MNSSLNFRRFSAVPAYASSITYHPNGLVNQVSHANGVLDLQEKDPTDMARPRRLRTSGASEDFDTGVYSWDGAGNVTKMGSFRFAYDLLSRIKEARMEVPGEGCGQVLLLDSGTDTGTVTHQSCGTVRAQGSYGVGSTGNVTLRAGHRVILGHGFSVASGGRLTLDTDPSLDPGGGATEASQDYTYDRFGNLLTMTTALEGQSPATRTLTTNSSTNRLSLASYDTSGNVFSWAGREYRWDAFNMLTHQKPTAGNGHTFLYGPGDERIWTIDWTAGASAPWLETWTLRDLDGTPLRQFRQDGGNARTTDWSFDRDYVYRNASLLAAHTPEGARHFHLDHLGSPRLVTNSSGTTLAQHLYFPFGEEATDSGQDSHVLKFTGHERDDLDSGGTTADLDYMHARYFSMHLGRFLSVDPLGDSAHQSRPQSWNRYSYALGNPLKYVDPYGLEAKCHTISGGESDEEQVVCTDEIDVEEEAPKLRPRVSVTPWQVGWEWLSGTGPRDRFFTDGDTFTEMLKQHENVQKTVKSACEGSAEASDRMDYQLGGIQGVPKYLRDYSTLATGGLTGNLAVTYLGSYSGSYTLSGGTVHMQVTNTSAAASALRPPVLGYTNWWLNKVDPRLNQLFASGPMSATRQTVAMSVECP